MSSTSPARGSSSWESTSRRPAGRRPSPEQPWGKGWPTQTPSTLRPGRPEPLHFAAFLGRPRPALWASVQNSSSVTPRLRSARSRNETTNACWSPFDRASAKSLISFTSAATCSGVASTPRPRRFSETAGAGGAPEAIPAGGRHGRAGLHRREAVRDRESEVVVSVERKLGRLQSPLQLLEEPRDAGRRHHADRIAHDGAVGSCRGARIV